MRCLLLAVVAGLAVLTVGIHAEDTAVDETGEVLEIELDRGEMARMLGDLFDDAEFEDAVEEQESNREARARGDKGEDSPVEEEKAVVDAKDQARYNSFIDTFCRRLNSYARSRFDPLSVGLDSKPKKGKASNSKKGKSGKDKNSKAKKEKIGKKDGKKRGKNGRKNAGKKNKKNNRHPKDLDLGEVTEEHDDPIVEEDEEVGEVHDISKREAEVIDLVEIDEDEEEETDLEEEDDDEEESLVRVARNADEDSDDTAMDETSRRGRPAKVGKKNSAKKGKKKKKGGNKKRKGNKKSGKKEGKKDNSKNKKSGKKGNKSKRSAKDSKTRTSRASITGIATVRRSGDVKVTNKKGGKEMRASFTLGPVDLKVSRKFGKGKDAVTKEARAVSPELTGKLSIHVASNGKARMTNFRINRPAIVQVEGSLRKSTKGGKADNNFMERSIGRFSPIASKKLKAASREILSAGESKAQAE